MLAQIDVPALRVGDKGGIHERLQVSGRIDLIHGLLIGEVDLAGIGDIHQICAVTHGLVDALAGLQGIGSCIFQRQRVIQHRSEFVAAADGLSLVFVRGNQGNRIARGVDPAKGVIFLRSQGKYLLFLAEMIVKVQYHQLLG